MRLFAPHTLTNDVPVASRPADDTRIVPRLKSLSRVAQGMLYMVASIFHFVTDFEMQIIPPFLPWRRAALYITGVCELLGGLGLLIPRFQRAASWGIAALLVAIWPANIYHAFVDKQRDEPSHRVYHWLRQPMQVVLILWALWSTSKSSDA